MAKKTVTLLVDDDPRLIRFVRANLESIKHEVVVAEDAETALHLLDREMPDLVILDIMLPGMDGFALCQRIREVSTVPIIMLTAKVEEQDKVKGLRLGADDYLTKPFGVLELLARVDAVLRRSRYPDNNDASPIFRCNDLAIDFLRFRVTKGDQEINLTPTEYRLLFELAKSAGRVVFHEDLLSKVWGPEYRNEMEYLRAYVRHLRKKIEEDPGRPRYIVSKPGIGYMFANSS